MAKFSSINEHFKVFDPVACSVYTSNSSIASGQTYPFDKKDYDSHNAWDTTNYKFVCPKAGIYKIVWGGFIGSSTDDVYRYYIYLNGGSIHKSHVRQNTKADYASSGSKSVVLNLNVGDEISIYFKSDGGTADYGNIDFASLTIIQLKDL
jgi:hypothetical protein